MKAFVVLCLTLVTTLNAATIAVIDSGVDIKHPRLKLNATTTGWNFAENNAQIFDPTLLAGFSADLKKFTEISSKAFLFSATEEEKTWAKEQAKTPGFSAEVNRYSTYVHGTHVSGIAVKGTKNKVMAIKLMATPVKATMVEALELKSNAPANETPEGVPEKPEEVLGFLLTRIAVQNGEKMKKIGAYVHTNGADVANGSFGMGILQAANISSMAFQAVYKRVPTEEEMVKNAVLFMGLTILIGKSFVDAAPNTLFVFAAGNDGLSNDLLGSSPANIKADNTITVAATYKDLFFAPFSNYGTEMVEIAAPGMLIRSSIPGDDYLEISGTSQAAPLVANVAGRMKDANPALKPLELKKLMMGTVDKKDFLTARVASGGIVNPERAVFAAVMSKQVSLSEAMVRAHVAVPAKLTPKSKITIPRNIRPIQMPSMFE